MTSPIKDLLSRARLVHKPYPQADIDAAAARLAARSALPGPHVASPPLSASAADPAPPAPQCIAVRDLRTLCEAVVTHTDALADLKLVAGDLMEPAGARVLGCMLQLTGREESARFWWQYAAGAGDTAATYCLYLHHRTLGEYGEAEWWHTQIDAAPEPEDINIPAALRILRLLKTGTPPVPDPVTAVLDYVPVAITYVDDEDVELPLPDPDFTDRIQALSAAAREPVPRSSGERSGALPERTFPRPATSPTGPGCEAKARGARSAV